MRAFVLVALVMPALNCYSADPSCDDPNNWAAMMTFVHLKNAGLTNNDKIDFNLTKVERVASEKIGEDLYRQVHLVTYVEKSGKSFDAITTNDASSTECSMSAVKVYVVEKTLGG
jgi:hypothetical protein